jgi:hypothetical protein
MAIFHGESTAQQDGGAPLASIFENTAVFERVGRQEFFKIANGGALVISERVAVAVWKDDEVTCLELRRTANAVAFEPTLP